MNKRKRNSKSKTKNKSFWLESNIFLVLIMIAIIILNLSLINASRLFRIAGDTSYNSTDTNITQERGFSHLKLADNLSAMLYMPFDLNTSNATDYSTLSNDGRLIDDGSASSYSLWTSSGFIG